MPGHPGARNFSMNCSRSWSDTVVAPGRTRPLDIQPVGGGDAAVPVSRVLDRALLASEVRVDQAVPLCVPFRPLEIVEQAPRVVRANAGPVRDRSCELREDLAVPLNSARVRYPSVVIAGGCVEIAAAALGDLDDRMVVFPGDLRNQVVDPTWPYFHARVR